jgi:16S rRNA (guanine527-N7)-methyltransferase
VRDLLSVHRELLEQWRGAMNLVGPGAVEEHYLDAQLALDRLSLQPHGTWVDLGTGAGFPGMVFAARYPSVAVELVDSRRKRCVFLEHVLAAAEVGERVVVRCTRVEELPSHRYDGVTARAFAPPEEVAEHAVRLLRPGGQLVLWVGPEAVVPSRPELELADDQPYEVGGKERRVVVLVRR